ncbi:MAG: cytochrome c biogenesis protein ResB [Planctomycetes bacterium]|nr:cytochrome c biogenesis protein ResB [Planctomycetota bacterium]
MDHTAIQPGVPAAKVAETAIQDGAPPGSPLHPDAHASPRRAPRHPIVQALMLLADLRLTVVLFALAMLIVFWGTLAQTDAGVWTVVNKYFRCAFVWVPLKVVCFNAIDNTVDAIPFPGGWLIGGVMLVNLLAAHAMRFKLTWNRSGIFLIHAGLIVMMLGEVITGTYQIEGQMVIREGQSSNTVIHPGQTELAIIQRDKDDVAKDHVVTIPARMLQTPGATIEDSQVPFIIEVVEYMVNHKLKFNRRPGKDQRGLAREFEALPQPEVSGVDPNQKFDLPAMYVKLSTPEGKKLGTWLFSSDLGDSQWITIKDKQYQVRLRFKELARPYTFHLKKFTHDVFPGTNTPKDFHSYIRLIDTKNGVDRDDVEIYMNAPLYYEGETFYQSSWTTDPITHKANGTVLQVVRNPGWLMPYISCAIVGIGMLIHFGHTLYRFVDRRMVR